MAACLGGTPLARIACLGSTPPARIAPHGRPSALELSHVADTVRAPSAARPACALTRSARSLRLHLGRLLPALDMCCPGFTFAWVDCWPHSRHCAVLSHRGGQPVAPPCAQPHKLNHKPAGGAASSSSSFREFVRPVSPPCNWKDVRAGHRFRCEGKKMLSTTTTTTLRVYVLLHVVLLLSTPSTIA